jgi:beta-phosphoglucomutase
MHNNFVSLARIPDLNEIRADLPNLKALFFDMDGTLFNTEGLHADALFMMAKKYQIIPPLPQNEVYQLMVGKADHLLFDIIKDWEGVPKHWDSGVFIQEKNKNFIQILKEKSVDSFYSLKVGELIKEAAQNKMFLGLITSSEKIITQELLKLTGLNHFFNLVLTRDDCLKHKPDPWPYLKALELSGHEKHEVVIFEDSSVGLEAAIRSGTHVIKVEWYEI